MRTQHVLRGVLLLVGVFGTTHLTAQDPADDVHIATMRPVIRGRTQAAASMKPEATGAAERILQAGGNASSRKLKKYPSSVKVYFPNGAAPMPGDIFRNPDLARTLHKLVDAEKENAAKGRHEALKAARDRFYKGDIARTMAQFSEAE